jgi:hypothetical protein
MPTFRHSSYNKSIDIVSDVVNPIQISASQMSSRNNPLVRSSNCDCMIGHTRIHEITGISALPQGGSVNGFSVKCLKPALTPLNPIEVKHGGNCNEFIIHELIPTKDVASYATTIGIDDKDSPFEHKPGNLATVVDPLGVHDDIPVWALDIYEPVVFLAIINSPRSSFGWGSNLIPYEALLQVGFKAPFVELVEGKFVMVSSSHPLMALIDDQMNPIKIDEGTINAAMHIGRQVSTSMSAKSLRKLVGLIAATIAATTLVLSVEAANLPRVDDKVVPYNCGSQKVRGGHYFFLHFLECNASSQPICFHDEYGDLARCMAQWSQTYELNVYGGEASCGKGGFKWAARWYQADGAKRDYWNPRCLRPTMEQHSSMMETLRKCGFVTDVELLRPCSLTYSFPIIQTSTLSDHMISHSQHYGSLSAKDLTTTESKHELTASMTNEPSLTSSGIFTLTFNKTDSSMIAKSLSKTHKMSISSDTSASCTPEITSLTSLASKTASVLNHSVSSATTKTESVLFHEVRLHSSSFSASDTGFDNISVLESCYPYTNISFDSSQTLATSNVKFADMSIRAQKVEISPGVLTASGITIVLSLTGTIQSLMRLLFEILTYIPIYVAIGQPICHPWRSYGILIGSYVVLMIMTVTVPLMIWLKPTRATRVNRTEMLSMVPANNYLCFVDGKPETGSWACFKSLFFDSRAVFRIDQISLIEGEFKEDERFLVGNSDIIKGSSITNAFLERFPVLKSDCLSSVKSYIQSYQMMAKPYSADFCKAMLKPAYTQRQRIDRVFNIHTNLVQMVVSDPTAAFMGTILITMFWQAGFAHGQDFSFPQCPIGKVVALAGHECRISSPMSEWVIEEAYTTAMTSRVTFAATGPYSPCRGYETSTFDVERSDGSRPVVAWTRIRDASDYWGMSARSYLPSELESIGYGKAGLCEPEFYLSVGLSPSDPELGDHIAIACSGTVTYGTLLKVNLPQLIVNKAQCSTSGTMMANVTIAPVLKSETKWIYVTDRGVYEVTDSIYRCENDLRCPFAIKLPLGFDQWGFREKLAYSSNHRIAQSVRSMLSNPDCTNRQCLDLNRTKMFISHLYNRPFEHEIQFNIKPQPKSSWQFNRPIVRERSKLTYRLLDPHAGKDGDYYSRSLPCKGLSPHTSGTSDFQFCTLITGNLPGEWCNTYSGPGPISTCLESRTYPCHAVMFPSQIEQSFNMQPEVLRMIHKTGECTLRLHKVEDFTFQLCNLSSLKFKNTSFYCDKVCKIPSTTTLCEANMTFDITLFPSIYEIFKTQAETSETGVKDEPFVVMPAQDSFAFGDFGSALGSVFSAASNALDSVISVPEKVTKALVSPLSDSTPISPIMIILILGAVVSLIVMLVLLQTSRK